MDRRGMDRRDVLKAAATAGAAVTLAGGAAVVAGPAAAQTAGVGVVDIAPLAPGYFTPGRFAGKTMIVTGCARGMGAGAAVRAAREGAQVVGVDILGDLGQAVIDAIVAEGGSSVFVQGDIAEEETSTRMIAAAVDNFGGLDCALNNAGVMDAVHPAEPPDFAAQRDLVFARFHESTDAYWDGVIRTNIYGT